MAQAGRIVQRVDFERLDDDTKRVRSLYQVVYQSDPSANEIELALRFLRAKAAKAELKEPLTPWECYGQVLLISN